MISNLEHKIIEKIGRSSYLINLKGKTVVLKKQPKAIYFKQTISRLVFGGSLPFQNEFRIMKVINSDKYIHNLEIIECQENQYFLIEYIEDKVPLEAWNDEIYMNLGKNVAQLSKLSSPKKWWFLKEWFFQRMESPNLNFLNKLKKFHKDHNINLDSFYFLFKKVSIISRSIKPRLIHNDLADNNVIVLNNDLIYFIDWEDAHLENMAIFLDLVSISFNYSDLTMNEAVFNGFWTNYNVAKEEEIHMLDLLAYSYIIYLFKILNMNRFDNAFKTKVKLQLEYYEKKQNKLYSFIQNYIDLR
jgi:Ser/Thr protein kinase RdoA (MazF antagonist)